MICSDDFVWLHFPKCAGTKTEQLFRKYLSGAPGVVQDPVGIQDDPEVKWHDSVATRTGRNTGFELNGRVVICPVRRLPSWLESRYSFEARRSPDLVHKPELLLQGQFMEQCGQLNHADNYCLTYLPEALLDSARIEFIRTECFERDFKRVFGSFLDISRIPDSEFSTRVNASGSMLPGGIREQLKSANREVYAACPYWARIEALAYPG